MMLLTYLGIYFGTLAVIFAMFRIDKRLSGAYVSGTEIVWIMVLFVPIINTLFVMLLVAMHLYRLIHPPKTPQKVVEVSKVLYNGVVDDIDDEVAYVSLYKNDDNEYPEESHAEIYLSKFPNSHPPEKGILFNIHADSTITYQQRPVPPDGPIRNI